MAAPSLLGLSAAEIMVEWPGSVDTDLGTPDTDSGLADTGSGGIPVSS